MWGGPFISYPAPVTSDLPRILIVDDDAQMRALIRAVCAGLTDRFHECSNGAEAVGVYRDIRPDWVLMDIRMDQLDGLSATRALRAFDPGARVVIVTDHGEAELRQAAREAGAQGFVLKDDLLDLPALLTFSPEEAV